MEQNNASYQRPFGFKQTIILLCILGVVFLSFSSSLNNHFVNWDDPEHFLENPEVESLDPGNISRIFQGNGVNAYRPLTILSFALEHHFFKFDPFYYHLDNIILHLGVTALVFVFALQAGLALPAAALAALLFGIHPMRVESVAWVTERKDVLYAFFYMLALSSYWRYLQSQKTIFYLLTIPLGILSMLAKPMALSLPLVFFVCDWFLKRKFDWRTLVEKFPHTLYIAAILTKTVETYDFSAQTGGMEAVLIWAWSFNFYLWKFLWPVELVALYQLPLPIALSNPPYLFSWLVLCLMIFLVFRFRKNRWWVFAVLFYFVSIACLLKYHGLDANVVADRYMYLPSLGFCLWLGMAGHKLLEFSRKAPVLKAGTYFLFIVLFSLFSWKTYHQSMVWKDSLTLWNHVIRYSPQQAIAFNNRGLAYEKLGQADLALADYRRALEINPSHSSSLNNRALFYGRSGKIDLALADYARALVAEPDDSRVYKNRGELYERQGKMGLAFADFNQAIRLCPNDADVFKLRGNAYLKIGQWDLALADYDAALRLTTEKAGLYNNRGVVYTKKQEYVAAMAEFNRAITLDPGTGLFYFNRSVLYKSFGDYPKALGDALTAKSLGQNVREAYISELKKNNKKKN